jgi:hypothetical protein
MQCSSCLTSKDPNCVVAEATNKVWCPTWTVANEGVLNLCDRHAEIFKTAKKGQFFYGDDASEQFIKVEAFTLKNDFKFETLKLEIVHNGYHIAGSMSGISSLISVLNGFVYIITCNFLITKLGKLEVVQQEMPKLFPEEGHRMIYVRVGDQDDYNGFVDLHGAIDYLQTKKVYKLKKTSRFSYDSDEFKRNNYISLYWGQNNPHSLNDHEPICDLTEDEVRQLNDRL